MLRHPDYTRKRITQLLGRFHGRIYRATRPVDSLAISPRTDRIPYAQAVQLRFRPVKLGTQLGPLYATYWFKLRVRVPRDWSSQRIDLLWSTHSEGQLWIHGRPVQGLNHSNGQDRLDAPLFPRARGGDQLDFFIETACNDAFGTHGRPWPRHRSPIFLDRADIGLFDPLAWQIYHDLRVLAELEREQSFAPSGGTALFAPPGQPGDLDRTWGGVLLFELNRFANEVDEDDPATWPRAHRILQNLLTARNGTWAHELSAIGHAHIDTAWLWPLAETLRKCTRTFSSQVSYMQAYPAYKFACSQAVQYHWMKQHHPDLYARIKARVKAGQWIPVGGTWVEPDCNIPSGEALIRQFLLGQRFFQKEFSLRCTEFWNPDVFGYNGQLPQIIRHCGASRFLTQKLSWNYFNKPLYHTFYWEGIDGSRVLAHFPPADTYNGDCQISQLRFHQRNYKDNDRSRHALYLFGYGDGGGGPTKSMIEVLGRCADLQGVPRCTQRSSSDFFDRLEKDARDIPTVVGELYFELHRGTFTSQAATKRNNRKAEFLLHDLEFLAAVAHRLGAARYPARDLEALWQTLLTHQFHDILPGSSVRHVYEDADRHYAEVFAQGQPLRHQLLSALAGGIGATTSLRGQSKIENHSSKIPAVPINTTSFPRAEVTATPDDELAFIEAPSYGLGCVTTPPDTVTVTQQAGRITLENAALQAVLAADGRLLSLAHKPTGRQALAAPGNLLQIYEDKPTNWDAWDVDPWLHETVKDCPPADACKVRRHGDLRAEVIFTRRIGRRSSLTQTVRLDAGARRLDFLCDVNWQEKQKMLKVAFPACIQALNATYEMQFGAVQRPTHFNNAIALAQYEVPGHKWADLSEPGFGLAVLSESKYGWTTRGHTIHLSLLRSTSSPDPQADRGRHHFAYALYPHEGSWQEGGVVAEGYRFNAPILWAPLSARQASVPAQAIPGGRSFFRISQGSLVLDTVKKAEDSDALVLRLYECHGARGQATLELGLPFQKAVLSNGLEDDGKPLTLRHQTLTLPYTPYQIITLKLA